MAQFLISSLVATIVLNLVLRLVPGLPQRLGRWLGSLTGPPPPEGGRPAPSPAAPRVQVFVPWKAMLIGSIGLTVLVNLVALLR